MNRIVLIAPREPVFY